MKFSGSVIAVLLMTASGSASALTSPDPLALESGGLAPPDPIQRDPYAQQQSATEQELAQADREDSGRGLEFVWLNGEVGYEFVGLQTFKSKKLVDPGLTKTTESGLVLGGGLGLRLLYLTVGGRFRLGQFSAWDLWTVNLEAGVHLPFGSIEPYVFVGGGYAAIGSFESSNLEGLNADSLDISGWNVRCGFGLDYYVTSVFSVGASASGDVLFLTRSKFGEIPTDTPDDVAGVYASDGKSIGGAGTVTGVLGLHF